MGLRELILGQSGLILDLRESFLGLKGVILGLKEPDWVLRGGTYVWMDEQTYRQTNVRKFTLVS